MWPAIWPLTSATSELVALPPLDQQGDEPGFEIRGERRPVNGSDGGEIGLRSESDVEQLIKLCQTREFALAVQAFLRGGCRQPGCSEMADYSSLSLPRNGYSATTGSAAGVVTTQVIAE
jgi:hypothetical protein